MRSRTGSSTRVVVAVVVGLSSVIITCGRLGCIAGLEGLTVIIIAVGAGVGIHIDTGIKIGIAHIDGTGTAVARVTCRQMVQIVNIILIRTHGGNVGRNRLGGGNAIIRVIGKVVEGGRRMDVGEGGIEIEIEIEVRDEGGMGGESGNMNGKSVGVREWLRVVTEVDVEIGIEGIVVWGESGVVVHVDIVVLFALLLVLVLVLVLVFCCICLFVCLFVLCFVVCVVCVLIVL